MARLKCFWINVLFLLLCVLDEIYTSTMTLEIEKFVVDRTPRTRTTASGNESVHFNHGDYLKVYFCLRTETNVAIVDILTSNDGRGDLIKVSMDGTPVGEVESPVHSSEGHVNWNKFVSSGRVGRSLRLSSGYHVIGIDISNVSPVSVLTNQYGVELDAIVLETDDKYLEEGVFRCSLYCVPGSLYDNGPQNDELPSIILQRKSYPLECPTQDNMIMPMFHPNPQGYVISAELPRYRSFENQALPRFEGCVQPSDIVWKFEKFSVPSSESLFVNPKYPVSSMRYRTTRMAHGIVLNVKFKPSPKDIDNQSNQVLSMEFGNIKYPFSVQMTYKGRNDWSEPTAKYFSPLVRSEIWVVDSDAWSIDQDSELELIILTNPYTPEVLEIEHLSLTRRSFRENRKKNIHQSQATRIDVVTKGTTNIGQSGKMKVRNMDRGSDVHPDVDYVSLFHILPWSKKYSEVLRFHHTGKLELLPLAPPGLDQVPFGSAFIVGQHNSTDRNPEAPIRDLDIWPEKLAFNVTYFDGGVSTLTFKPSLQKSQVIVNGIEFRNSPEEMAFVSLTSMWLNDGNSEVDHVSTNGNQVRHVVNGWQNLYGTSFSFMKKCISKFNTQGPDMTLKLISDSEMYQYE